MLELEAYIVSLLPNILPLAAPIIAFISALVAYRSSRIARKSLELARITAQTSYEVAKTGHTPAVDLILTEIEYRDLPREAAWAIARDEELEVVV